MAAKRRAGDDVVRAHRPLVAEHRPERHEAASQRLPDRHEVRRDPEVLDAPHLAGPTEPRLDLVGNEEPAVGVRELPQSADEVLRWDPYARLQGDRLEDSPRD